MHTLRRSSPKGLAGKEPACKCSTANVYVHVYFLRLYIFTFKRAIYRYFLANFARIDVIMIIFEKNKAMENLFGLTQYYSWRSAESPKGAQVDLVIDRADGIINLCEVKYSTGEYSISKDEFMKLSNRSEVFRRESGTKKGIFLTLITTYGLSRNGYSDIANNTITMADLFL